MVAAFTGRGGLHPSTFPLTWPDARAGAARRDRPAGRPRRPAPAEGRRDERSRPALRGRAVHVSGRRRATRSTEVTLDIDEGTFALAVGPTGAGKSTLLRASNGLVPHFTGGTFRGRVTVDGRDTLEHPAAQARRRGRVRAAGSGAPRSCWIASRTSSRTAWRTWASTPRTCAGAWRRRSTCSTSSRCAPAASARCRGGERQRVAIAAALAAGPRILVLDEPTSQLDPQGAEDVVAALQRLGARPGITVLLAEHRLERVAGFVDLALGFVGRTRRGGSSRGGDPPVGDGPAGRAARTAGRLGPGAAHGARGARGCGAAPIGDAGRPRIQVAAPGDHARRTREASRRGTATCPRSARHRPHDRPRRDRRA